MESSDKDNIGIEKAINLLLGHIEEMEKIHGSDKEMGKPWYIPGYGTTGSKIGASFSIYYTLPWGNYKKHSATKQGNSPSDINAGTEIVPNDNAAQPTTVSPSDNGNQNEQ